MISGQFPFQNTISCVYWATFDDDVIDDVNDNVNEWFEYHKSVLQAITIRKRGPLPMFNFFMGGEGVKIHEVGFSPIS